MQSTLVNWTNLENHPIVYVLKQISKQNYKKVFLSQNNFSQTQKKKQLSLIKIIIYF